jgi:hypothetical protein
MAPPPSGGPSVADVFAALARHPIDRLVRGWNWKSALLSSLLRGVILFFANLTAGWRPASAAFLVELVFRAAISGVYGALTEAFAAAQPAWAAFLAAMVVMPITSQLLQLAVHYANGTPELARSVWISTAVTLVSTAFNVFAMRRGTLLVGEGRSTIADDLRRLPRLIHDFVLWPFTSGGSSR